MRSVGLLKTNGVTSQSEQGVARGHGLFPVFSLTNHSCVANTRHVKRDEVFCLVATLDIDKDEEITTSYKSPSLGTIVRRPQFRQNWNFDCTCLRYGSNVHCTG